jgi:hypothetical protein
VDHLEECGVVVENFFHDLGECASSVGHPRSNSVKLLVLDGMLCNI